MLSLQGYSESFRLEVSKLGLHILKEILLLDITNVYIARLRVILFAGLSVVPASLFLGSGLLIFVSIPMLIKLLLLVVVFYMARVQLIY